MILGLYECASSLHFCCRLANIKLLIFFQLTQILCFLTTFCVWWEFSDFDAAGVVVVVVAKFEPKGKIPFIVKFSVQGCICRF
jgi:hypothetical protein